MYKSACVVLLAALLGPAVFLGSGAVHADSVKVKISGIEKTRLENARAFLSIVTETEKPETGLFQRLKSGADSKQPKYKPPTGKQIQRWHQDAEAEIAESLEPLGYYNPTIKTQLRESEPGKWVADYEVDRGVRSRWRKVTVSLTGEGSTEPFIKTLLKKSVVREGKKVSHRRYAERKREWIVELYAQGYLDARFVEAFLTVDKKANVADVEWTVDTGPRYRFGEIKIAQDILRPTLVERYHGILEGDVFDTRRLIDLQLKLNNSNYFESVSLDIQKDQAQNAHIPIVVNTVPRKRRRYDLGLGFGTDTGPRVSAGIESRRVNKRGHRYRLNARASGVESALQAEYIIPIKEVTKDRWRIYAQVLRADVGDADGIQYSLGAGREDSWRGVRRRLFVNAERSSFEFGDLGSQNATLIYPGVTLSFDRLDDPQFVRRGFSLAATLQGGADAAGSVTDFVSLQLTGRGILPFGKRGRLLAAAEARVLEAGNFSALPPSQRFFLGGDRSVRGYAFQGISPENAFGDDIGGSRSLSFNLEADYRVKGNWGVAAFFDAGDVSDGTPTNFLKGVGLGVRYRSPVGMIRIDVAHPLDDPDNDVRVHLSIGPDL